MNIGIIGSGNMGGGLGKIWSEKGHRVLFSDGHNATHLADLVEQAGTNARAGSPAEAVDFGDIVVLTVRWPDVADALNAMGSLAGKTLLSCINPLKPDFSGLEVGLTTSAAEEIARLAPGAHVVECLFLGAPIINAPDRQFGGDTPTVFYCGDSAEAKAQIAPLIRDIGATPEDAGPLSNARYLEPFNMLIVQLGILAGWHTDFALRLLRR